MLGIFCPFCLIKTHIRSIGSKQLCSKQYKHIFALKEFSNSIFLSVSSLSPGLEHAPFVFAEMVRWADQTHTHAHTHKTQASH